MPRILRMGARLQQDDLRELMLVVLVSLGLLGGGCARPAPPHTLQPVVISSNFGEF